MNRNIISALCVVAVALAVFSGCNKKPTSGQTNAPTAAPLSAPSPSNLEHCKEMTGTVYQYIDGMLTLEIPETGKAYLFHLGGAELRCTNGLNSGDTATVFYMPATDPTQSPRVVLVVDTTAKASHNLGTMHGTLVDVTMHSLMLRAADGTQYAFDKTGAQVYAVNGLVIGNTVDITYTVKDGANVAVTITDNAANAKEYSPLPEGVTLVVGTETLMAANNINVYSGAGTQYSRIGGITAGSKVYLTGTCSNGYARINDGGKEGYVAQEHLVAVPEPPKPVAPPVVAQPAPAPATTTPPPIVPAPVTNEHPIGTGVTVNDVPLPAAAPVPVPNDVPIGAGVTVAPPAPAPVASSAPPAAPPAPAADPDIGNGATVAPPAPAADPGIGNGAMVNQPTAGGIGAGVTLNTAPEFLHLVGTVTDLTGDILTITDEQGNTYAVNIAQATAQYTNGIQPGNRVTIHYSGVLNGTDTSAITVMMVTVAAVNSPIAGMVSRA